MLGPIRKFSSSIYAKILMIIIIIPFVFWGMGSNFMGGSKNVIVVIDKEKYSSQAFFNFIEKFASPNQKIESEQKGNEKKNRRKREGKPKEFMIKQGDFVQKLKNIKKNLRIKHQKKNIYVLKRLLK